MQYVFVDIESGMARAHYDSAIEAYEALQRLEERSSGAPARVVVEQWDDDGELSDAEIVTGSEMLAAAPPATNDNMLGIATTVATKFVTTEFVTTTTVPRRASRSGTVRGGTAWSGHAG